jgi:lipoprotein-anchoring transpeptidase ErfK/SrfK
MLSVRARGLVLLLVTTAALALPANALALQVWFVQDGRLTATERRAAGVRGAVRAVLRGPTAPERAQGLRTAIPRGVQLRGIEIQRRVVTLDLGARIAAGDDEKALRARLGQLVRTVGGVPGVRGIRLLVHGGVPLGLFPGYDLRRTLTPQAVKDVAGPSVRELQELLSDLGFAARGNATGVEDERTGVAVLGFEKWARLPRDGRLDPQTASALMRAARPQAVQRLGKGRRVEVLLDRQLALLIEDDRVRRAVHISTGAYGRTPVGSFRVFRKELMSWSVPFSVWMPWASYFVGGIAFHQYPSVPAYPASHGCVRVNRFDAPLLFGFAAQGTPVRVFSVS